MLITGEYIVRISSKLAKLPTLAEICVGFACGIALYYSLMFEPSLPVLWLFAPLILIILLLSNQFKKWRFVYLMLAILLAGFGYVGLYSHFQSSNTLANSTYALNLTGSADEVDRLTGGHERLTLSNIIYPESYNGTRPEKVRLTVRVASDFYKAGDYLEVRAILEPPPRPVYPNGYDSARKYYYNNIGALGYVIAPVMVVSNNDNAQAQITWRTKIDLLRDRISQSIEQHLDGQTAAVATALLTGIRSKISNEVRDNMRTSGLAHLLAISGLHMALFTGVLFFIVRALLALSPRVALVYPIKKIAAVVAWFGGAYYLFISGMGVSTLRAFTMVSIVILAVLVDRQAISMRLLAFAALVVLIINPSALVSASFQMSFAAVFGLIAVFEAWRKYVQKHYDIAAESIDYENLGQLNDSRGNTHPLPPLFQNRFVAYPLGVIASTFVAEVSLLPVSAFHFHRFATYGLVANLFAMPLMGFWIMPFGLAVLILYPFGLEGWALVPMGWGIDAMLYVAATVASLNASLVDIPNIPMFSFLGFVFAALLMVKLKGRTRVGVVGALLLFSALLWRTNTAPQIIVESQGKMVAVSDNAGGYYFSSLRSGRYARARWAERFGLEETPHFREYDDEAGLIACDQQGCIYNYENFSVGLPQSFSALAQDCLRVDIIITQLRVQGTCPKPKLIIDSRTLHYNGAHALWLSADGIEVKSVEGERGKRLWSFDKD